MIETGLISESNETALLSCILKDEGYLLQVIESVPLEAFGYSKTREIYKVILNLFEHSKQITRENLYGSLSQEISTYFTEIRKAKINIDLFSDYLYNVKNKYLLRQYKILADDVDALVETDITGDEVNEIVQERIFSLNQQTTSEISSFESNLFDIIPHPDSYHESQKREFFGISSGLKELDKITIGFHPGCYTTIGGRPSCVSGDTILHIGHYIDGDFHRVKSRNITIENLYKNRNNIPRKHVTTWDNSIQRLVRCYKEDENLTGLTPIVDVLYQGEKETYTVVTNTGKKIRATLDHKFLCQNKQYLPLSELKVGDIIFCKADKVPNKISKKSVNVPDVITKMPYYKNAKSRIIGGITYQRQLISRLTWDAYLNKMSVPEFIMETRNPDNTLICSSLQDEIHHIDEDRANNDISNLICLSKQEHRALHSHLGNRAQFGLDLIQEEYITSIEYYGIEPVYDISCADPYHNFIGNDFVLHNCSKTLLVRQILVYNALQGKPVAFFSMDESEAIIKMKIVSSITGIDYNHLKRQELNKEELSILRKNLDVFKTIPFFIDTTPQLSVNVLRSKMKKLLYKYPDLCGVGIDYVQQMSGKGNSLNEKLTNISIGLKAIGQEFKVPLFVVSQLSRSIEHRAFEYDEKWTDPPILSDLKESGALEADMDKGIFMKIEPRMDDSNNFKEKLKTRIFVLKQRDGEAGKWLDAYTVGKKQRIEEMTNDNTLMF